MRVVIMLCAVVVTALTGCGLDPLGLEESNADERWFAKQDYIIEKVGAGSFKQILHEIDENCPRVGPWLEYRDWEPSSPDGKLRLIDVDNGLYSVDAFFDPNWEANRPPKVRDLPEYRNLCKHCF